MCIILRGCVHTTLLHNYSLGNRATNYSYSNYKINHRVLLGTSCYFLPFWLLPGTSGYLRVPLGTSGYLQVFWVCLGTSGYIWVTSGYFLILPGLSIITLTVHYLVSFLLNLNIVYGKKWLYEIPYASLESKNDNLKNSSRKEL